MNPQSYTPMGWTSQTVQISAFSYYLGLIHLAFFLFVVLTFATSSGTIFVPLDRLATMVSQFPNTGVAVLEPARGYCYLALVPVASWQRCAALLGRNPPWHRLRWFLSRMGLESNLTAVYRVSATQFHVGPGLSPYTRGRNSPSPRDHVGLPFSGGRLSPVLEEGDETAPSRERPLSVFSASSEFPAVLEARATGQVNWLNLDGTPKPGVHIGEDKGKPRFDTDYEWRQDSGTWDHRGKVSLHFGAFRAAEHRPGMPGWCYLALFRHRYQVVAERHLGAFPCGASVHEYVRYHKPWLRPGEALIADDEPVTLTSGGLVYTGVSHIRLARAEEKGRHAGAVAAHVRFARHVGAFDIQHWKTVSGLSPEDRRLYGDQGAELEAAGPAPLLATEHASDGFTMIAKGHMYRSDQFSGGRRDPDTPTLHNLTADVFKRARYCTPCLGEKGERQGSLWDQAVDLFKQSVSDLPAKACVVVSADSGPDKKQLLKAPSELWGPATHGIMFVSTFRDPWDVHHGWAQIALPLEPGEGRLLAGLRTIPQYWGRSDLFFLSVNALNMNVAFEDRSLAHEANLGYASITDQWTPTNMGCHYNQGCIFEPDRDLVRASFTHDGEIYGWDEAILYVRSPVSIITGKPIPWRFNCWRFGTIHTDVTWLGPLESSRGKGPIYLQGLHRKLTTRKDVVTWDRFGFAEGDFASTRAVANSPWKTVAEAFDENDKTCADLGIPTIDWLNTGPTIERIGARYCHAAILVDGVKFAFPGAQWRGGDRACGLRSRLVAYTTQGVSPELWSETLAPTFEGPDDLVSYLRRKGEALRRTELTKTKSGPVGVAAVRNVEEAALFAATHEKIFKRWIWLSESSFDGPGPEDTCMALPRTRGTGFIFQLARLYPFVYGNRKVVYSCVNDLETNWLPRSERFKRGLEAIAFTKIIFPAQGLCHPCPFQDVIGWGSGIDHLEESFLQGLARFGWVYGYDEVWCGCHQFPTLSLRDNPVSSASVNMENPVPAWLWQNDGEGYKASLVPRGEFLSFMNGELEAEKVKWVRPSMWTRLNHWLRGGSSSVNYWNREEWTLWAADYCHRHYRAGRRSLVIFRWGTHGDRVPFDLPARMLSESGLTVHVVDLCDPEEGKRLLEICERRRSYEFIPELFNTVVIVRSCGIPYIAPDFLYPCSDGLPYSLRPHDRSLRSLGGGLPVSIDWMTRFALLPTPLKLRIGAYRGSRWLPRAYDGENFLPRKPLVRGQEGRKGYVLGSSALPIPEEYTHWDPVPTGDHFRLFQDFDTIACAGGAGVVQTAAVAGCKVQVWSDVIDRDYVFPKDAGKGIDGNEHARRWYLVAAHFYPSYYRKYIWCSILSPRDLYAGLVFAWDSWNMWGFIWKCLYLWQVLKYVPILPTPAATLLRAMKLPSEGPFGFLATQASVGLFDMYLLRVGRSRSSFYVTAGWTFMKGFTSPSASILSWLGINPLLAGFLAGGWLAMGGFGGAIEFGKGLRFGSLHKGQDPAVWLCYTAAHAGSVPVGMHSFYYDSAEGVRYEGTHVTNTQSIGTPFKYTSTKASKVKFLYAHATGMRTGEVPKADGNTAPYSAFHNCQTITLSILLRNQGKLLSFEILLAYLSSAWAFLALGIFSVVMVIASSGALTICFAARKANVPGAATVARTMDAFMRWLSRWVPQHAGQPELEEDQIVNGSAAIAASMIADGHDQDIVFEALSEVVPAWVRRYEDKRPSDDITDHIYLQRRGPSEKGAQHLKESLTWLAHTINHSCQVLGVPRVAVEGVLGSLVTVAAGGAVASRELACGVAQILDYLDTLGVTGPTKVFAEIITHMLDAAGVPYEERKKNVWAVLGDKHIEEFRRSDWMMIARHWGQQPVIGTAASTVIRNLNAAYRGTDPIDLNTVFVRPQFLPNQPRVSAQELRFPSLLQSVDWQLDEMTTERALKYMKMGGKQGIDGMWHSTDENRYKSLERYLSPALPMTDDDTLFADTVAEAMYSMHPAAFEKPQVVRPETVWAHLTKKFSPGLPWIGRHKKRSELVASGWMNALIQATYAALESGQYPPQLYHEFAKMQVVDAEKILEPGRLRTVVAQDLASSMVDQVVQLERNKRPTWKDGNHGIGMPATAGVMARIVEDVAKRGTTFSADCTAFDANCPPWVYRVLTTLGQLGAVSSGIPQIGEVLRCKYYGMQKSTIVDLPTGLVYDSQRGGGTGQSSTSWDNTWGMRAIMIGTWALATGKNPGEFYNFNSVHNTGDDNLWGCDDVEDPDILSAVAKEYFGLDLRIEARGAPTELTYLGKKVIRASDVSHELARVGVSDLTWTLAPKRDQLLMRRSAIVTRASGKPAREYYDHRLSRSVGQSALLAHDPAFYTMLAEEWMEEALLYSNLRSRIQFAVERNADGYIEKVDIIHDPTWVPRHREAHALKKLRTSLALPSYQKVLEDQYKERPSDVTLSPHFYKRVKEPLEVKLRSMITEFRLYSHSTIPEALSKLAPALNAAPFSRIFYAQGYPVETFVYQRLMDKDPNAGQALFNQQLRNAPFSIATDASGFYWYTQLPGVAEAILAEPRSRAKGRMFIATGAYIGITSLIAFLRRIPWIGLAIEAFQVYTQDMSKWYSSLNHLHWLGSGESSAMISSLSPKDPFATQKQASVVLASNCPDFLAEIIGILLPDWLLTVPANILARFAMLRAGAGSLDLAYRDIKDNSWTGFASQLWDKSAANMATGTIVKAPTATGKSTLLPGALRPHLNWKRIWLVLPRIVLRENYENEWWPPGQIVKLSRDSPDTGAQLAVLTYGYLLGLMASGKGPVIGDLILLDEFHENAPDMGLCWHALRGVHRTLFLSATPNTLFAPDAELYEVPLEARFSTASPVRLDLPTIDLFFEAQRDHPEAAARALIIVPTVREAGAIASALVDANFEASVLDRTHRAVPASGVIVATQIADSGMNINPPALLLVDSGKRYTQHKGRLRLMESDRNTEIQRRGRVGRLADGLVYCHLLSGTGNEPLPYPSWTRLLHAHGREWLLNTLGIDYSSLSVMPGNSGFDPFMAISAEVRAVATKDVLRSLCAFWGFCCEAGSVSGGDERYLATTNMGWGEHENGIRDLLRTQIGGEYLLPRGTLAKYLSVHPFEVCYLGVVMKAMLIRFEDDRTVVV